MSKGKLYHSFQELAEATRFEASKKKGGGKPKQLPPPPKQPVLTSHEKPKVSGRVNGRKRRPSPPSAGR